MQLRKHAVSSRRQQASSEIREIWGVNPSLALPFACRPPRDITLRYKFLDELRRLAKLLSNLDAARSLIAEAYKFGSSHFSVRSFRSRLDLSRVTARHLSQMAATHSTADPLAIKSAALLSTYLISRTACKATIRSEKDSQSKMDFASESSDDAGSDYEPPSQLKTDSSFSEDVTDEDVIPRSRKRKRGTPTASKSKSTLQPQPRKSLRNLATSTKRPTSTSPATADQKLLPTPTATTPSRNTSPEHLQTKARSAAALSQVSETPRRDLQNEQNATPRHLPGHPAIPHMEDIETVLKARLILVRCALETEVKISMSFDTVCGLLELEAAFLEEIGNARDRFLVGCTELKLLPPEALRTCQNEAEREGASNKTNSAAGSVSGQNLDDVMSDGSPGAAVDEVKLMDTNPRRISRVTTLGSTTSQNGTSAQFTTQTDVAFPRDAKGRFLQRAVEGNATKKIAKESASVQEEVTPRTCTTFRAPVTDPGPPIGNWNDYVRRTSLYRPSSLLHGNGAGPDEHSLPLRDTKTRRTPLSVRHTTPPVLTVASGPTEDSALGSQPIDRDTNDSSQGNSTAPKSGPSEKSSNIQLVTNDTTYSAIEDNDLPTKQNEKDKRSSDQVQPTEHPNTSQASQTPPKSTQATPLPAQRSAQLPPAAPSLSTSASRANKSLSSLSSHARRNVRSPSLEMISARGRQKQVVDLTGDD